MKKVVLAIVMMGMVRVKPVMAADYYCVDKNSKAVISRTANQTDCVNVDGGEWVSASTIRGLTFCIRNGQNASSAMSASECSNRGGTTMSGSDYLAGIDNGTVSTSSGSGTGTGTGSGSGGSAGTGGSSGGGTGSGSSSGMSGSSDPNCVQTMFFGEVCGSDGVFRILGIVLDVLTYGVGVLAVLGFVVVGIQYTTARDNEGQVAKAKERIGQIVIGLVIYALLYALLQFLIPGGVF